MVDLTHVKTYAVLGCNFSGRTRGAFLESPGNLLFLGPVIKTIFSSAVSKNGEVHVPETSCIKRTSVHIKNMWVKQLCNCKVRDVAMALRARKVSGAFGKRATWPIRLARERATGSCIAKLHYKK